MNYINLEDVRLIHQKIILKQKSLKGELNIGLLESALFQIQNDEYYPSFEDKLTHLVFCCVKFHPFVDANKRTALLIGALFLKINQTNANIKNWFLKMEDVVVNLANNEIDKNKLQMIIGVIINE